MAVSDEGSVPGVCEIARYGEAAPDLVIEIPHGATRTAEYDALRARLAGDIAADLVDFFHVNTDAGAPEIGTALAEEWAARGRSSVVIRSCIPRTFVDCNRVIDVSPEFYREGKVTPGVPPWIRDPGDLALLTALHADYVRLATAQIDAVCGGGGLALFLHTYAPRSVDVEVDDAIVANLHRAYLPGAQDRFPLRAEVDVIGRALDGTLQIPATLLGSLVSEFGAIGIAVADGQTYPLHPSTQAYHHALRHPGRTVCVEIRRDLVADPFDPFVEMRISPERAWRIALPLGRALATA